MTTNELRQKYLDFFKSKGHKVVSSSSLLPENDPTTLFTGSGMQPMVPYLLGAPHPSGRRVADSQKCFRAQDIEEVGDNRHTTFFEMLGNWSLGDYFKADQIPWVFEFVTKELGLDPNRLYVTCFRGNADLNIPKDEESAALWQDVFKQVGIEAAVGENSEKDGMKDGERIFYYDETRNWWSRSGVPATMPVGEPGGPDSEMFWDFGGHLGLHEKSEWKDTPCHVNCDCGRFLEIGNSVFMQYKKTDGGFEELPQKNVDFGGGLERMAAARNDDPDMFQIDLFQGIFDEMKRKYGLDYITAKEDKKREMRIIADHLRASVFMIADGVVPSNTDQGYVLRRLMRRAIFKAWNLAPGFSNLFPLTTVVIDEYKDFYQYLSKRQSHITAIFEEEELRFGKTLERGKKEFEHLLKKGTITGKDAFILFSTYGYPIDLTVEHAREKGIDVDIAEFEQEKEKHAALSRKGAEKKFKGGLADHSEMSVKYHTATHLLHAAVRKVLGEDAVQKGSNITPERLRFDFSYPTKLTPEQKQEIEDLVNAAIERDYPVTFAMMPADEARAKGAIGLFDENYGDEVKVYTVGDPSEPATADPSAPTFSREFCGGPHVEHTGMLGHFKIKKEESVGAGVRRIKAIFE